MTIAIISIIIVAIITCVSVYNLKEKQIRQLNKRLMEEDEKTRAHNYEVYDNHKAEIKKRDLIDIKLVTDCNDEQSEILYNKLIESGLYFDFYNACSTDERLKIIKKAKQSKGGIL